MSVALESSLTHLDLSRNSFDYEETEVRLIYRDRFGVSLTKTQLKILFLSDDPMLWQIFHIS